MGVDQTTDDKVVAAAMQQLNGDGFETKGSSPYYFSGLSKRNCRARGREKRDGTLEFPRQCPP
jgi:hypothetical protein